MTIKHDYQYGFKPHYYDKVLGVSAGLGFDRKISQTFGDSSRASAALNPS